MTLESDFKLHPGAGPLVLSVPHAGTAVPFSIAARMTAAGRASTDSDRYVDRLYRAATGFGATLLVANWSRYVVDLNRDPSDTPLYPDRFQTTVCPTETFDRAPLYLPGQEPEGRGIRDRVERYWRPYHAALRAALDLAIERHGFALLWDAHSIRDEVPNLFEGRLPDLNLGTHSGQSCAPALRRLLEESLLGEDGYTHVVDGRFTGGYITRHYGNPEEGVHAVQMEMTQPLYMEQYPPFAFLPNRAARLEATLLNLVRRMAAFDPGA